MIDSIDCSDVKDRSVLKIVQLNGQSRPHVSFKEPEFDRLKDENLVAYQRLSRTSLTDRLIDHSSRSLSEPRREQLPPSSTSA